MSAQLNTLRSRYERIAIPTIWVAFALSLLLHAALLAGRLPQVHLLPVEELDPTKQSNSLSVRLAPLPGPALAPPLSGAPPSVPAIRAQPVPAHKAPPPRATPKQPSAPRVLTLERPSPSGAPPPRAETARQPPGDDLASFIEARRRARGPAAAAPPAQASPPAPPAETDQERHNRIVAENLGLTRAPSFGEDRKRGGGIFQVQRMGYDSAEFVFFGWNKFIKRNAPQTIEVRRGDNATLELAVVRRMIAIIREQERGDFVWQSHRLGREVSLSARPSDNAGIEDFMLREFFPNVRSGN